MELIGAGLFGLGGIAAKALFGSKAPPPAALPNASRDDAEKIAAADDELRKRRGGAADILMGAKGAEAPLSGGKLVLGS